MYPAAVPHLTLSGVQLNLLPKFDSNSLKLLQKLFQTCRRRSNSLGSIFQAPWNIPLCGNKAWITRWQFRIIPLFVLSFQILKVLTFCKLFKLFFIKHQINNGWEPFWTWISWYRLSNANPALKDSSKAILQPNFSFSPQRSG